MLQSQAANGFSNNRIELEFQSFRNFTAVICCYVIVTSTPLHPLRNSAFAQSQATESTHSTPNTFAFTFATIA